jgi:hypothetical protein
MLEMAIVIDLVIVFLVIVDSMIILMPQQ